MPEILRQDEVEDKSKKVEYEVHTLPASISLLLWPYMDPSQLV